jgi:hypothetical protein
MLFLQNSFRVFLCDAIFPDALCDNRASLAALCGQITSPQAEEDGSAFIQNLQHLPGSRNF